MDLLRLTVAMLVPLGTAALVTRDTCAQGYPAEWPALATSSKQCPELSGSFLNADRQNQHSRFLASWIQPSTGVPQAFIDRVDFTGPRDGVVTITVREKGAVAGVRYWTEKKDYRCEGGWLVLPQPLYWFPGFAVRSAANVARTVAGDLVIDHAEAGGGIVDGKPSFGRLHTWHLYEAITPAP